MNRKTSIPTVSVNYARTGASTKSNELGMRPMQERAYGFCSKPDSFPRPRRVIP